MGISFLEIFDLKTSAKLSNPKGEAQGCGGSFQSFSLVQSGDLGWWFGGFENNHFLRSKIEVSWKLCEIIVFNRAANELNHA